MGTSGAIDFFYIALFSLFGLCLGSFASALIYRIPRDISWIFDKSSDDNKTSRSQCPSCGAKLGIADLVPLFSWLLSRAKCRHCHQKIPAFYPLVELTTMFLVLGLFWVWGLTASAFPIYLAVPFLIAALVIDWEHFILPDDINIALFILSCGYLLISWGESGWDFAILQDGVVAAALLVSIFWFVSFVLGKIKGRGALGRGDLKFLPSAGLFLGVSALPTFMALSGVLGLVAALLKGANKDDGAFPFGPALIISLYVHVFLTGLGFDYKW